MTDVHVHEVNLVYHFIAIFMLNPWCRPKYNYT